MNTQPPDRRFTLIELLVVIAIISVLVDGRILWFSHKEGANFAFLDGHVDYVNVNTNGSPSRISSMPSNWHVGQDANILWK